MIIQPMPIPPLANDLQHAYAGHLFRLRGFLPNNNASQPSEKTFSLAQYHVDEGQEVAVNGELPSPPVLAHIANVAMSIKSSVNPSTDRVRVSLVVPRGVSNGLVSLIWPSKTLTSEKPLLITTQRFDLQQENGVPDEFLFVGLFPVKPSEVYIGETLLQLDDIRWQNSVLQIRTHDCSSPGLILVVAQSDVYQSRQCVLIKKSTKTTVMSPATR